MAKEEWSIEQLIEQIYTILRGYEFLYVEKYIRPNLSGPLSKGVSSQLEKILEEQFREGRYGEVGGCIVPAGKSLKFEVIETKEKQKIEQALSDYEAGTISQESQQLLLECASYVKEYHEKQLGEENTFVMVLSMIYEIFSVSSASDDFKKWSEQARKKSCLLYKEHILDNIYLISLDEITPESIGLFHVHNNGSEPSSNDVEKNIILPYLDVVISATREYKENGVALYLVHNGTSEKLYQGLLQIGKQ